jgi:UDP:flavonoid glycosyltransferase YjiC (YdhE family)
VPTKKNVLVCPLNWGLGHASRCIPIINFLKTQGHNITIAACGSALALLKNTFPETQIVNFKDYNIKYSKGEKLTLKILLQIPKILIGIITEHRLLKKIIKLYDIDVVISDNRFGLWNKKIKSIYITHQLFIKTACENTFIENFLKTAHRYFILKYNFCWVPDLPGDFKLAGELSGKYKPPKNSFFIGLLSSLEKQEYSEKKEYDFCVVLSGPEPQRTLFQQIILKQLQKSDKKAVLILGVPSEPIEKTSENNLVIFNFLPASEIQKYMMKSEFFIARSGYSTIMDLAATGQKAILVPTPGQPEQEYLAKYFSEKKIYYSVKQKDFCLEVAMKHTDDYTGIYVKNNSALFEEIILKTI